MMAGVLRSMPRSLRFDVLRSCGWAGFGLLGAVTGVGWELGVP